MSMDLTRPNAVMKEKALKHNIDLDDPLVLEEFRAMQLQNLEDMRRLILGKP